MNSNSGNGSKLALNERNVQSFETDNLKNFQILDDLRKLILKKQNANDSTVSSGIQNSMHLVKSASNVSYMLVSKDK